ncbi:MAG: hypothetical protein AAGA85_12675 [Bacteroidota bacterium]
MRFPSLIRLPRNKQFEVKPRYYDPIKEELEERTERIRAELRGEAASNPGHRITFERKAASTPNASLIQLLIAAILSLTVVGWLYLGNDIAYALIIVIPVYFYFRFRKMIRK